MAPIPDAKSNPNIATGCQKPRPPQVEVGVSRTGIFIGTTTVIWLVAIGEGVSYRAQQQILDLGAQNIIIRSVEPNTTDESADSRVKRYGLTRKDLERIAVNDKIKETVAIRESRFELRYKHRTVEVKLVGCSEEHLNMNRLQIVRGRWINQRDDGDKVVVLAHQTAATLFPMKTPLARKFGWGPISTPWAVRPTNAPHRRPSVAASIQGSTTLTLTSPSRPFTNGLATG